MTDAELLSMLASEAERRSPAIITARAIQVHRGRTVWVFVCEWVLVDMTSPSSPGHATRYGVRSLSRSARP